MKRTNFKGKKTALCNFLIDDEIFQAYKKFCREVMRRTISQDLREVIILKLNFYQEVEGEKKLKELLKNGKIK